ncbi:competence protein F, partial [Rhizobium sp. Pop5]
SDGTVETCDGLIPVPLHRTRMLARKFNQAAELARHMAGLSGKPLLAATLIRVKRTSQQVGLGAKAREDNVRGAFAIAKGSENDVFESVSCSSTTSIRQGRRLLLQAGRCARQGLPISRF